MHQLINGFHLELTNICTLKCPGCSRTQFINTWPQHWKNHSLDIKQLFNFIDIDIDQKIFNLCGNYGDPIYHPQLFELVSELKNRGAVVKLITNGSYQKKSWWDKLVNTLTDRDTIIFSIDGTPDNFTQYRINADWTSVKTAIQSSVNGKCQTVWKYIVFKFNQDNIEQAQLISQELGIKKFIVVKSDRFDSQTQYLSPDKIFLGDKFDSQQSWKTNSIKSNKITPMCANGKEYYISADGYYMPCCYIGDHRFFYKTVFGKQKNKFSIADTKLTEILGMSEVQNFTNSLESQAVCQYNCPNTTPRS